MAQRQLNELDEMQVTLMVGALKEAVRVYCKDINMSAWAEHYNLYYAIETAIRSECANAKFLKETIDGNQK